MVYTTSIIVVAAMIAISSNAYAQKIYENVDRQGVVEFSDHPSPSATEIEVKPNVVDITPVTPLSSTASASANGAAETPAVSVEPDVIGEGVADDYFGGYANPKERKRELKERIEHREGAVRQPAPKEIGRTPERGGVHGR